MDKSFVYLRESEDDPKKTASIQDQAFKVNELRENEEYKGVPVLDTLSEKKSAKIPGKRFRFLEMMDRIEEGEAEIIFCWKASRLARNPKEGGWIIQLVDEDRLKIITCYGVFDKSNAKNLWDEFKDSSEYSKNLSKDVIESVNRKVREGAYPGKAKLGYKNYVPDMRGPRYIVPDSEQFHLFREWLKLLLTGQYTIRKSLELMYPKGLRGKKGGKISESAAGYFLRNPFCAGYFKMNPERFQGQLFKGSIIPPNNHVPMITLSEWFKLQRILDCRNTRKDGQKHPLWFQGIDIWRCASCGSGITGETHKKTYKNGNTQIFEHAHCTRKKGKCKEPFLNIKTTKKQLGLEDQIKKFLSEMQLHPKYIEWVKGVLHRRNEELFETDSIQKKVQTNRLMAILQEKKLLTQMKIDQSIEPDEFDRQLKPFMDEEKQIREAMAVDEVPQWAKLIDDTLDFAKNMTEIFDSGDIFTKQMVLKIIGSNLYLKDRYIRIEAKTAFIGLKEVQTKVIAEDSWLEPVKDYSDNLNGHSGKITSELWAIRDSNP